MAKKTPTQVPQAIRPKVQDISSNTQLTPFITAAMLEEPFFGHIFRHINFVPTETMPTAGVSVAGGDITMYWNPEYLSSLTNRQVFGLLKHEAFHLVFQHCTKRRLEPHIVHNIAADLAINCGIPGDETHSSWFRPGRAPTGPDGKPDASPLSKLVASLPPDLSTEEYFSRLMDDPQAKKQMEEMEQGGSSGSSDDHEGWGAGSAEEADLAKGRIGQILKDAISKADRSNGWGNMSSSMRERLRELVSNEVDWRALLRHFVKASRRGQSTSTWTNCHMSNIHPDFGPASPGKKRGYTSNINVYFDQSGSMADVWVELLFAELKQFAQRTDFDCYVFDTVVNEASKIKYKGRRTPELHGVRQNCGGTDFDAPTKHAAKQKDLDGMIICTDGGAAKPAKSKVKRCYVLAPGQDLAFEPDPEDVVVRMKAPGKGQ